jgi:hypothetical protein
MLRTGSVKPDKEKLAKLKTEISSVSLRQVTPILVVLTSGTAMAIFITIVELLSLWKALRYKLQNVIYLISERMLWPR